MVIGHLKRRPQVEIESDVMHFACYQYQKLQLPAGAMGWGGSNKAEASGSLQCRLNMEENVAKRKKWQSRGCVMTLIKI